MQEFKKGPVFVKLSQAIFCFDAISVMEYQQKSYELSMKRRVFRKDYPDIQGGLGTPVILQSNLKTDDSCQLMHGKVYIYH